MRIRRAPRRLVPPFFGSTSGTEDSEAAKRLGESFVRRREQAGVSVVDLAAQTQLKVSEVKGLEKGISPVAAETMLRLAVALDVTTGELLTWIVPSEEA